MLIVKLAKQRTLSIYQNKKLSFWQTLCASAVTPLDRAVNRFSLLFRSHMLIDKSCRNCLKLTELFYRVLRREPGLR